VDKGAEQTHGTAPKFSLPSFPHPPKKYGNFRDLLNIHWANNPVLQNFSSFRENQQTYEII